MSAYRTPRFLGMACALTFIVTIASRATFAQERNTELETLRREVDELRRSDAEKQKKLDDLTRKIDALLSSSAATSQPAATQPAPGASALDRAIAQLPGQPP